MGDWDLLFPVIVFRDIQHAAAQYGTPYDGLLLSVFEDCPSD